MREQSEQLQSTQSSSDWLEMNQCEENYGCEYNREEIVIIENLNFSLLLNLLNG
jgi:hypothetical protein